MNVTCPSCETVYRVDPAKVPAGGVRARCAVCSNVFPVNASVAAATAAVSAGSGPAVAPRPPAPPPARSEEHTSELQSHSDLVCRLLLEKKKTLSGADTHSGLRMIDARETRAANSTAHGQ